MLSYASQETNKRIERRGATRRNEHIRIPGWTAKMDDTVKWLGKCASKLHENWNNDSKQ